MCVFTILKFLLIKSDIRMCMFTILMLRHVKHFKNLLSQLLSVAKTVIAGCKMRVFIPEMT